MSMNQAKTADAKRHDLSSVGPLIALVALIASLTASAALAYMHSKFTQGYVELGEGLKVAVTVAATDTTREKGLSGKEGLRADEGMLFLFDQPNTYGFWMKDMKFPIDIIWINDGAVVDITTDAALPAAGEELPVYYPRVPVDKVLEVQAGFAKAHGLRTGLHVGIHVDKQKKVR
jgi:uncharacterized protein